MENIPWSQLSLTVVVVLVLGLVVMKAFDLSKAKVEKDKPKEKEMESGKDDTPMIPAELFAKIIAAAVAEAVRPFQDVVNNNTEALNEIKLLITKQGGKTDNILTNTNLLLQERRRGGGDN